MAGNYSTQRQPLCPTNFSLSMAGIAQLDDKLKFVGQDLDAAHRKQLV